ncbi:hypothetical protein ACWPKS_08845 [Coraliomargarita sp. W4R72]
MINNTGFLILLTLLCGLRVLSAAEVENVQLNFRVYLWPERSTIAAIGAAGADAQQADSLMDLPSEEWSDAIVENYEAPKVSYFVDGLQESAGLRLNEGRLSDVYEYHGPQQIRFFRETTSFEQEVSRIPLASISVSPTVKELILLFFPAGKGKYQVLPVESSLAAVKAGTAMVYNLTSTKLSCTFGGPTFELLPKQAQLQPLSIFDGNYQPILAASQDEDGQWKRRLVRKLSISEESSMLFVIYNLAEKPERFKLLAIDIERDELESM